MNKTSVIKKIIGNAIKEYGFEYIRCDQKIVWIFGRIINDVEEHIIIQQHKRDVLEYKLMFSTTTKGNGRKEIGNILPEYKENEYWKAESDKEFETTMCFFAEFIKDKGINILDDMLEEKPDSFETPERKMWFKEHRSELISKYEERYHILAEGSSFEQVCKIDEVLYKNRFSEEDDKSVEKVYELILGMAAILSEIMLQEENSTITYDTYFVEVQIPYEDRFLSAWPIRDVAQAWIRYHTGEALENMFVWCSNKGHLTDSSVRMKEGEFKEYVERIIARSGKAIDESCDDKSGADYIINGNDFRILIKRVYTDTIVDIQKIKKELKSITPNDYDKTIFVLNQDITDQAIRFAVTRPHRTKVVTCRNTYSLSSMISNWLV